LEHALALMEQLAQKNAGLERARREPIAIVGMACRFPGGADGPAAFWKLLQEGRDAIRPLGSRWQWLGVAPPDAPDWAGLLREEEVSELDAAFFEISDREARSLDPQQRLVLTVAWEALENAGVSPRSLLGSATGVFVGSSGSEYPRFGERVPPRERDAYFATGGMVSGMAGRLSYVLGLQGPAVTMDTACSSSLVATHLACQSLRAQECHLAIAGGVNLILSPDVMAAIALTRSLSPDGRCRTFDARANGFVRGEGCGVLVLKRLSDAQREGDRIWAVVRGSAVNQDGKSTGLTAPNVLAQQRLLRDALGAARVDPAHVDFVETHGTGTALGDPIELEALKAVLGAARADGAKCLLGAVKTQIGHLEAAAGVAGMMKVALALHHRALPGNLGFQSLNPLIQLEGTPLVVAEKGVPLPRPGRALVAGVSAFGLSGTNAHVVMEEAPAVAVREAVAPRHAVPVLFSARTPEALSLQVGRVRAHLEAHPEISLVDAAHTLAVARAHFEERAVVVGRERAGVIEALGEIGPRTGAVRSSQDVAVLFPGSGGGSSRALYEGFEAFRAPFDAACGLLSVAPEQALGAASEVALLAQHVALYRLCESWGLKAGVVLGTEVGEISAAHVAGALSLEDACRLALARDGLAKAVIDLGGSAHVDLEASEDEVRSFVKGKEGSVAIAAVLGPRRTRVSGEAAAVRAVAEVAEGLGRRTWRVVDRPWEFQSRRVERAREALEELERAGRAVASKMPELPIVSGSAGAMVGAAQLGEAGYWARQARLPVRFQGAMRALEANGTALFLELGSSAGLIALAPECLGEGAGARACFRNAGEADALVEAMAAFHARGAAIDWAVFFSRLGGRRVELPPSPFLGRRHWFPAPAREAASPRTAGPHPVLLERSVFAETGAAVWTGRLDGDAQPWLPEHGVGGVAIFPAAASLELMGWAFSREVGAAGFDLESVSAERPMVFEPGSRRDVQVIVHRDGAVALYSRPEGEGGWTRHARAQARALERSGQSLPAESLREEMQRLPQAMDGAQFYASWKARGNLWGPTFQGVERMRYGDGACIARIRAGAAGRSGGHLVHPALLDACGQALAVFALAKPSGPFVGRSVGRCRLHAPLRGEGFWSRIQLRRMDGRFLSGDMAVHGEDGELLLEVEGLEIELLHAAPSADPRGWTYERRWARADAKGGELQGRWLFVGAEPELRVGLEGVLGARALFAERWQEPAAQAALADPELRGAVYLAAPEVERAAPEVEEAASRGAPRAPSEDASEVKSAAPAVMWSTPPPTALRAAAEGTEGAVSVAMEAMAPLAALRAPARLWWVTRGRWSTSPASPLAHAALWGLGLSVSVEHAARWGGLIDLPAAGRELAPSLVRALALGPSERQISVRDDGLYVARLVRLHAPTEELPSLSPGAAYLVTGGLGGLGTKVAEWLADRGARHLVLMGRTGLPERRHWRDLPPDSKAAAAAATIRALEARGAHVEVAAVDVADAGALAQWLERYRAEDRPPLSGVVHAAGVLEPAPAQEINPARLRRHLAPKLGGALALERALSDQPLDFFISFSSASALVASPQLGEYAAANACLDAFADRRRAAGKPALSIAWGPWADAGMVVAVSKQAGRAFQTMSVMGSAEALAVMGSLWRGPSCPAVLPIDWERWRTSYRTLLDDPFYASFEGPPASTTAPTEALAPASDEALEPTLIERLGELLGSSAAIDPEESLVSLGMDSLMAYEAQGFIQQRWGVEVPVMQFLKGDSTSALAGFIRRAMQSARPPAPSQAPEAGPERIEFTAPDGLRLFGHLSLPPGPGPHPAVVVHTANAGGALDEQGRYAQLHEHAPLVAAGFAVLTVDQRGSLGHGEEHFRKADLGGRDADDLIAAADALAKRPEIDAARLGLCGTSRGAYVGLLALERAPHRFSAAVLRMGFYDPVAYVEGERQLRPETSPVLAMFPSWEQALAFMSAPDRDPRRHLSAVRAPLLLVHGEADRIVDPEQSRALVAAAREQGITIALRGVPVMGHDIQETHAAWPEIWKEIAEFLRRHLPVRPIKSDPVPLQATDFPGRM
jgi:myxalamid-type polyketide synthase MxaE and MxaD